VAPKSRNEFDRYNMRDGAADPPPDTRQDQQRLMAYLLKWRYQPERRSRSWRRSVRDSRTQIERLLADSPSLAGELPRLIEVEWPRAVRWAGDETRIVRRAFPADCPWTQAELLDPDFLPDG
jgi:hypothetical protein